MAWFNPIGVTAPEGEFVADSEDTLCPRVHYGWCVLLRVINEHCVNVRPALVHGRLFQVCESTDSLISSQKLKPVWRHNLQEVWG